VPKFQIFTTFTIFVMSSLTKRIPVSEPVWKELAEMRSAGQTYDELLEDMIDRVKKLRLEEDIRKWESLPDSDYVSLSEIED
jgi:predicted CopG family antitoxin